MVSSKLIFAFLFAIKLIINMGPLSAVSSPAFPVRTASLTSIRVDPGFPDVHYGLYCFGERVPGKEFLPPALFINIPPNQRGDGIREHTALIESPNGERITRVILQSRLDSHSRGERVHETGFSPNQKSVSIKFWSKPYHGIDFSVNLYGLPSNCSSNASKEELCLT